MIDKERVGQASRYVLGTLSAEEKREFEAALRLDSRLELLVQQLRGTEGGATGSRAEPSPPSVESPTADAIVHAPAAASTGDGAAPSAVAPAKVPGWMLWTPWLLATAFAVLGVVLTSLLIASSRSLRRQASELSGRLERKLQESADLQRRNALLDRAAAESTAHAEQRIREAEAKLVKGMEEFSRQNSVLTNQLVRQLEATNRALASAQSNVQTLARTKKALEDALETLGTRERDRFKMVRLIALRPPVGEPSRSLGAAFWSPNDQRGVLTVENLPALPSSQGYQLWLVDAKGGAPVSGGLLPVSAGSARVQFTADARIENLQRVFITVESVLGAAAPGGATVLSGN